LVANGSPYNNVNMVQMPNPAIIPPMPDINFAQTYNVYWDTTTPTVYNIDSAYSWSNLILLPISMTDRKILTTMPSAQYNNLRIVMKNATVSAILFANQLYVVDPTASSSDTFSLQPVSGKGSSVTLSIKTDTMTNVKYVQIANNSQTYNYQYLFQSLSAQQLQSYQYNVWKTQTVADVNGQIFLQANLPANADQVQLQAVSQSSVLNLPDGATSNLSRVLYDAGNDRYLAQIYPTGGSSDQGPFYTYFNQNGYADLESGALFDTTGVAVGSTLQVNDLVALLQQLSIIVGHDKVSNKTQLVYRPSQLSTVATAQRGAPHHGAHRKSSSRTSILGRLSSMIFG